MKYKSGATDVASYRTVREDSVIRVARVFSTAPVIYYYGRDEITG
jgi:hypothetical protein